MAIAGYEYRKDGGSPVDVDNVLSKLVTGLTPDTDYAFEVRAYDGGGNRSPWAAAVPSPVHTPAGPPPSVDPGTIASLRMLLRATDIVGSNLDPLSGWADQSGHSNDAVQVTSSGFRPVYHTTGGPPTTLKYVNFDGSNQYFDLADFSAFTAGELFVAMKLDADPPADGTSAGCWKFGTSGLDGFFPDPSNPNDFYTDFGASARHTVTGTRAALSSWCVVNIYSATNDWALRINDVLAGSALTSNTVAFSATPKFGLSGGTLLKGQVAYIALFNAKLSSSGDRSGVYQFIKNALGI